jgi:hypothetical protein
MVYKLNMVKTLFNFVKLKMHYILVNIVLFGTKLCAFETHK